MPKINHVKKAQQRFAMTPKLDADGSPIRVPVMRPDGTQKTTKRGKPVFRTPSVRDTSQPLPMPTCDFCRRTIEVGSSYKYVDLMSRGTRFRHSECPNWHPWELSGSLSARIAQIQYEAVVEIDESMDVDDIVGETSGVADEIRALAEEKREAAQNIEDGFGHPTYQSDELNEIADRLESWADEVEYIPFEDKPEDGPFEDWVQACQQLWEDAINGAPY